MCCTVKGWSFNIVPGTVNVTQGKAGARKVDLNEGDEVYSSQRLPRVPDTLVARGGASSVTFKELVSSTPFVRLHPITVNMTGVSSTKTSDKKTEDKLIRHYQPWVKSFEGGARP